MKEAMLSRSRYVRHAFKAVLHACLALATLDTAGAKENGSGTAKPTAHGFSLLNAVVQPGASTAQSVQIGDVTGDGRADVVVASTNSPVAADAYQLFLYTQSPTGVLSSPSRYPSQRAFHGALALINLDDAGGLDVVAGGQEGTMRFISGIGGALSPLAPTAGRGVSAFLNIDLDRDGRTDLVSTGWDGGGDYLMAIGGGHLNGSHWNHQGGAWRGMGRADFDNDDIDDVVALSPLGMFNNLYVFSGTSQGALVESSTRYAKCSSGDAWSVGAGDFNSDGNADIVVGGGGNVPSSCLLIFLGRGDGTFESPVQIASDDLPWIIMVADIDLDDRDDVIVLHNQHMTVGIYRQSGFGQLEPEVTYPIPYASYGTQGLAVGDINGDGCPDVAIADSLHGLVTLSGSGCNLIFRGGFEPP